MREQTSYKTKYRYSPKDDKINEHRYIYSGVSCDFIGNCAFILSVVNVCLSLFLYKIALFIGILVLLFARFQQTQYDSPAVPAAYCGGFISITISAFIWIVTVFIFGGA